MSEKIPEICPGCAIALLDRPEWFSNREVLRKARLGYARGLPRLLSSEFFARKVIGAITIGATIYFRIDSLYDPHTPSGLAFLAHELKHVEQYQNAKLVKFYTHYLVDYIRYHYGEKIAYEAEAYAFQKVVQNHLKQEFEHNHPRTPCLEMGTPHTFNQAFIKLPVQPFALP